VLLLDEPLSALDEFLRLRMRGELKRLQTQLGITFIHVTHTQLEAIALADLVVVMDQGRIEQAGSAREIYGAPKTPYVARFMGGQNVLSGTLQGVEDGTPVAVGATGERFAYPVAGSPPPGGARVWISMRRDCVGLGPAGDGGAGALNALSGTVRAIEYQGSWVKVTIDSKGAGEFVANLPDAAYFARPVAPGDAVVARWPTAEIRVLSAPHGDAKQPYSGRL